MNDLRTLKKEIKEVYDRIESIHCPIIGETVYFNSDGYIHLIYESNRKPRVIAEQWLKLKCFPYVPRVIDRCKRITEIRKVKRIVGGVVKEVTQYELVHEAIPQIRFRVVIEKIGAGNHVFKSVMPNGNKDKRRMFGRVKTKKRQ